MHLLKFYENWHFQSVLQAFLLHSTALFLFWFVLREGEQFRYVRSLSTKVVSTLTHSLMDSRNIMTCILSAVNQTNYDSHWLCYFTWQIMTWSTNAGIYNRVGKFSTLKDSDYYQLWWSNFIHIECIFWSSSKVVKNN